MDFNKKAFSNILNKIYTSYSNQRDFAKKANINRTYISKYINMKLEEPPSVKILKKITNASNGITTYQELMQICGYLEDNETISIYNSKVEQILELANGLNIQDINYIVKQLNNAKVLIKKLPQPDTK